MRFLYITTISGTMVFFQSIIKELIEKGNEVDIACSEVEKIPACYNALGCKIYPLSCSRFPFKKGNIDAIKQIEKIVDENNYDIVHCHTPIAAACTRLACRKARKRGTKVFYTAHGFHFYKGAPLKNWLIYYPIEKLCAHFTDVLITINNEDYALAQKKMKAKKVAYVPGVGIDLDKFGKATVNIAKKREELGVPVDAFLLISVGELSERKNHKLILQALTQIDNTNIHYVIIGKGPLLQELQSYANEHQIAHRVHLLGYRKDVAELYKVSDLCCFPSIHEGLPVALMEAMACGVPIVCSRIRGNTDLIDASGGILFDPHSVDECCQAIVDMLNSDMKRMSDVNKDCVQNYSIDKIIMEMKSIYES